MAERAGYGSVKVGAAFFAWLSATGMGIIRTALLAAAGTAVTTTRSTASASAHNRERRD
ncbi:hypothetical protein [Intrasporangium sp.]|uniref:hypothetical protein n=1 Tax=Intrasporangium sp. TaxID=1925024 RepID=UPI0033656D41